jgi:DNA-binding Xre family transcriptional regulator
MSKEIKIQNLKKMIHDLEIKKRKIEAQLEICRANLEKYESQK